MQMRTKGQSIYSDKSCGIEFPERSSFSDYSLENFEAFSVSSPQNLPVRRIKQKQKQMKAREKGGLAFIYL